MTDTSISSKDATSAVIDFAALIAQKDPFQGKSLKAYLSDQPPSFFKMADRFLRCFAEMDGFSDETLADAYVGLCREMVAEQIRFKKTGKYSAASAAEVNQSLYSAPRMKARTLALGVSQFFWPNHQGLLNFFLDELSKGAKPRRYLEIGPGHGIHLACAIEAFPSAEITALDISEGSLGLSKALVSRLRPQSQVRFSQGDVCAQDFSNFGTFDFIVMNEVLEHLDDPASVLKALHRCADRSAKVFITTCTNAPAIDHVYLYSTVEEIRDQLASCGFRILRERALPVGRVPEDQWTRLKTEVNYAAMLEPIV